MKVVQVKCPACNTPVQSKVKDRLFFCNQCGTMHVRDGGVNRVDFEIAEFSPSAPQAERVYVPFWRMYCSFVIRSKSVEGGYMFRLSSWLRGDGDSGSLFVYVPATDVDTAAFKHYSSMFTASPPRYATRLNFGAVRRLPASLTKEEAEEMADFVVVTMEAEKPGVLQRLDYSLKVDDSKVVYLPFVLTSSGMTPAL